MTSAGDVLGPASEIHYETESYLIELLSDTRLRWTRMQGQDTGVGDEESYVATQLDSHRWMISWVEARGLALSNVIDLSSGVILTHGSEGRDVFANPGQYARRE